MRYFLLAGEASGDNLGALLAKAIRARDPEAEFAFWGGASLEAATGLAPKQHIRDLAFMGFVEVVANLPTILRLIRAAKADVAAFAPDVLVCIDYPGFNLRLARWAKRRGIRVDFYVSPQIWAWRRSRVHRVVADTDRVLCVLPFEPAFYRAYGYEVDYTGHPLPARVDAYRAPGAIDVQLGGGRSERLAGGALALLPGSRAQEVRRQLATMAAAARLLRERDPEHSLRPVIAAAPVLRDGDLDAIARDFGVGYHRDAYAVLSHAELACVSSGTATLETALFGVPQVVAYRGGALSVAIARRVIRVEHIALVNLILGEAVVPELIQTDFTPERVAEALTRLAAPPERERVRARYARVREALEPYDAAGAAADLIVADARAARDVSHRPR